MELHKNSGQNVEDLWALKSQDEILVASKCPNLQLIFRILRLMRTWIAKFCNQVLRHANRQIQWVLRWELNQARKGVSPEIQQWQDK